MKLTIGFSPCPNDTFIFDAIVHQKIDTDVRHAYLKRASADRRNGSANTSGDLSQLDDEQGRSLAEREEMILSVTENGYGKRTSAYEYRITRRGGQGIINIATSPRNGPVVASFAVKAADQLMLVTDAGKLIRIPISDIRIAGRNTQGVTLFKTKKSERVVSVIRLGAESEIDNIGGDENTEGDKADEPEELAGDMENEL